MSDKHLTKVAFNQLMLIEELVAEDRDKYIDQLIVDNGVIAHILAIAASDLEAAMPPEVGYDEQGVCNVSKVVEVFLQAALHTQIQDVDFNDREVLLFSVLSSSTMLGISARKLAYNSMLPEVHVSIPYLLAGRSQPTPSREVLTCGVCRRKLRSVSSDEGTCTSCKGLLASYTAYRNRPFYLPLNSLNIPYIGKEKEYEKVEYVYEEWLFLSEALGITAEPVVPTDGRQPTLEIKEYQKPIH